MMSFFRKGRKALWKPIVMYSTAYCYNLLKTTLKEWASQRETNRSLWHLHKEKRCKLYYLVGGPGSRHYSTTQHHFLLDIQAPIQQPLLWPFTCTIVARSSALLEGQTKRRRSTFLNRDWSYVRTLNVQTLIIIIITPDPSSWCLNGLSMIQYI